jgi:hypothetical protein
MKALFQVPFDFAVSLQTSGSAPHFETGHDLPSLETLHGVFSVM